MDKKKKKRVNWKKELYKFAESVSKETSDIEYNYDKMRQSRETISDRLNKLSLKADKVSSKAKPKTKK